MTPFESNRALNDWLRSRRLKPEPKPRKTSPLQEIERICRILDVSPREVLGTSRAAHISTVRFIISHHLCENRGLSLSVVGRAMNRNHSTINYHLKQYDNLKSTKNREFLEMIDKVKTI